MEPIDNLSDLFSFPDFVPATHCAIDDNALSVRIELRDKDRPQKVSAVLVDSFAGRFTASEIVTCEIFRLAAITSRWSFPNVDFTVRGAV